MNAHPAGNGEGQRHGLLESGRRKFLAVTLSLVAIAGVAELSTGAGRDAVGSYLNNHTLIDNPYYSPDPMGEADDPTQEPRISITELHKMQATERKEIAAETQGIIKATNSFYEGVSFFNALPKTSLPKDTAAKGQLAESIRGNLDNLMSGVGDTERDGAGLFRDIVDDTTARKLKEDGIAVETAKPNGDEDLGTSTVVPAEDGKFIVQFVPDNNKVPEGSPSPIDPGVPEAGTTISRVSPRQHLAEYKIKLQADLDEVLSGLRNKVAAGGLLPCSRGILNYKKFINMI
jgi:hypothetical protein